MNSLKSLRFFCSGVPFYRNPNPVLPRQRSRPCKVNGVILDLSGTTCDPYVLGPALAFHQAFEIEGVPITMDEARKPMGCRKDLHIQQILDSDRVSRLWNETKGRPYGNDDVKRIFEHFLSVENKVLKDFSDLIPGTEEAIRILRFSLGCKIGITTGFTRESANILLYETRKKGLILDSAVAGDDIPNGMGSRPAPFMIYRNMEAFGLYDRSCIVKVDDTVIGVQEGLNAGVWTVGVYRYSNYTNIRNIEEMQHIEREELEKRIGHSRQVHLGSGAHYVAESIVQLPEIIEDINKRLSMGETPQV